MSLQASSQLLRCAPYFPVADVARAVEYYGRVLGFRLEYSGGTPPRFAIVSRDGWPLMFRAVADPALISPNEKQGGTWDAFIWERDVSELQDEIGSGGAVDGYGAGGAGGYQGGG